jgi:hypothetical protein
LSSLISLIQVLITNLVSALLSPFKNFSPVIGLSVVSVIAGLLLILAYKKISFQSAITKTKRNIHASLLESVVFRHDTVQCLRAQRQMLFSGVKYLLLAIPPLLILAIPSLFFLAELQTRYGYRSLRSNEPMIVRAQFSDLKLINDATLTVDEGVIVAGPVRVSQSSEVFWRISSSKNGLYQASLKISGVPVITQLISVGESVRRLNPIHYYFGWHQLLFPLDIEVSSPKDTLRLIEFSYPDSKLSFLSMNISWVFVFLIISMCTGLLLSRILGIEV